MNDNTINTGIEKVTQAPPGSTRNLGILSKIWDKIPPQIKEILLKFYANKKIFWPITILFGIMFLIIILGLLFGSPNAPAPIPTRSPTPVPFVEATPAPCATSDQLCVIGNQLKDLNNQVNSLDLNQGRLQPPQINYDIRF